MDLTCTENLEKVCSAGNDTVIFGDHRVLHKLLRDEILSVPHSDYFETVQNDIQPFMRKVVTTWMLEVCEEQMCEDQILPLAINLMDRFLSVCAIKKQQLQLLGATCLLIASKYRSTTSLPVTLLCAYTDNSVTYDYIIGWELLVLSKLKWNVASVTGFDYIDHIMERCSWGHENNLVRRHAHTLVSICYTEPSLIQTRPSVIAAACISSAVKGLKLSSTETAVNDICHLLNVDLPTIDFLVAVIDNAVAQVVAPSQNIQSEKNVRSQGYESPKYGQPETPTEVENIYF